MPVENPLYVVEDDELMSNVIDAYAQLVGIQSDNILHFNSSEQLCSQLGKIVQVDQVPQLVVIDVMLAGSQSGLGLLQKFRDQSNLEDVPIIVTSAGDDTMGFSDCCRRYKRVAYLPKPFSRMQFIETLKQLDYASN